MSERHPPEPCNPATVAVAEEQLLVAKLVEGDREAAALFVRANAGWMIQLARRYLRDQASAEDCVQESFMSAFAALRGYQGRAHLKSWLHRIVVNAALMRLRKQRRLAEEPIDHLLPEFEHDGSRIGPFGRPVSTPEELLQQSQIRAIVASKIDELPEIYRTILLLRDIDELSTADVAEALGLSEGNVKIRLHRARAALKRLLEPHLSPAVTAADQRAILAPVAKDRGATRRCARSKTALKAAFA